MKPEKVDRVRKKKEQNTAEIKTEGPEGEQIFVEIKNLSSSSSGYGSDDVDISALAEECFFEQDILVEDGDTTMQKSSSRDINIQPEFLFDSHFNEIPQTINLLSEISSNPAMHFTQEEEFRIFELMVRKENLFDGCFQIIMELPYFADSFTKFILSLKSGETGQRNKGDCIQVVSQIRKYIVENFKKGGIIRQALDMFEEYKYVTEAVKKETFFFALPIFHLVVKAILRANMSKQSFKHQYQAAGFYTASFQRACNNVHHSHDFPALSCFDPLKVPLFTSPWAERREDEEFFRRTLNTVGDIIGDDVKLGTLFCVMVLVSPGSQVARRDPHLTLVQREMALFMFRYLQHKLGHSRSASNITTDLMRFNLLIYCISAKMLGNMMFRLIEDLHTCRDIHLYGRKDFVFEDLTI